MKFVIALMIGVLSFTLGTVFAQEQDPESPTPETNGGFAFVDIQRVATESDAGQDANTSVQALSEEKLSEIEARTAELQENVTSLNEQLQELQQKLQEGQTIMSAEARLGLQREIAQLERDIQRTAQDSQAEAERLSQDAEAEVQALQQQLQIEFQQKLVPIIEQVAEDKKLSFIFSAGEGGLIWANTSLDLTQELIELLNAQTGGTP